MTPEHRIERLLARVDEEVERAEYEALIAADASDWAFGGDRYLEAAGFAKGVRSLAAVVREVLGPYGSE